MKNRVNLDIAKPVKPHKTEEVHKLEKSYRPDKLQNQDKPNKFDKPDKIKNENCLEILGANEAFIFRAKSLHSICTCIV